MSSRTLPVKEVCDRYGVGEHTVLTWLRTGQLMGIDVSRRPGGKPRWRITEEALAAFEVARTPVPRLPRQRKRKQANDQQLKFIR